MALVINPTFDSSITSDPNAATIEATINRTIAAYESLITDNITVDITFKEITTGLGQSNSTYYFIDYKDYRSALVSHATTADDATAIASLPDQTNNPVNNDPQVRIKAPLGRALGFNTPGGGTISLNTSICNLDQTSAQDSSKYDLQAVIAHEIDEVIGFGSRLDGVNNGDPVPTGNVAADDLFRYDQNGARSFSTSATDQAYFSIDGGSTNLARFNQQQGGDFGDWYSTGPHTYQVQDAYSSPGQNANLTSELTRLDILGFTTVVHAPQVTAAADQAGVEGASKGFNLGSFTDPDAAPWGVTVSWGDGSPNTSYFLNSAGTLGSKSHTFTEEGSYTVTVTVTDFTNQTQSKTFQVNVSDPAVIATGKSISPVEGTDATWVVATFTDPGGNEPTNDYSADINWGDGTAASAGSIFFNGTSYEVRGTHTYVEESAADHPGSQPYVITVTIHHDAAPTTQVMSSATVSDPSVVAVGVPVYAVDCMTTTVTTATFTDPGGSEDLSDYSASIDWGDGTAASAGSISYAGGVFTVAGAHAYASQGNYTITTTINHEASTPTVASSPATIKDDIGLLLLDPSGPGSLFIAGNGDVLVTGCGAVIVNSNSPGYAAAVVQNGEVTAEQITVTGGAYVSDNGAVTPGVDHAAAIPDPLGLGLPSPPSPVFGAVYDTSYGTLALTPGTYLGGIHVSRNASVTLAPGVYYMAGGGFSVSDNGSVTGNDVLIVNVPSGPGDGVNFTGNAKVNLTALESGPYQGVAILQDPSSSVPIQVARNARLSVAGVVYAAAAAVNLSGNAVVTINPGPGTATLPPIYGALIAYDLHVVENGSLTINPDDPSLIAPVMHGSASLAATAGAADVNAAAIASLVFGGVDREALDQVALSLVGASSDAVGWLTTVPTKKRT